MTAPKEGARPKQVYTQEKKAHVLAEVIMGHTSQSIAEKYDIPVGTVQTWKQEATQLNPVQREKKEELGELVTEYVREALRTLRNQSIAFGDVDYLHAQNAADNAILHGVMADKVGRIIASLQSINAEG